MPNESVGGNTGWHSSGPGAPSRTISANWENIQIPEPWPDVRENSNVINSINSQRGFLKNMKINLHKDMVEHQRKFKNELSNIRDEEGYKQVERMVEEAARRRGN